MEIDEIMDGMDAYVYPEYWERAKACLKVLGLYDDVFYAEYEPMPTDGSKDLKKKYNLWRKLIDDLQKIKVDYIRIC